MPPSPSLPHVLIVGAGFGGLKLARALARAPVRVTVLDQANHHLFQPLLYQVALAGLSPAHIAVPIRSVLRRQANTQVLLGELVAVDAAARSVRLRDGATIAYDFLVLAMGARTNWFGHPDWAQHAYGLKTIDDALAIRTRVLLDYEAAEREPDAARRKALLTFVLIGGGPTGVELAGTLAELSRTLLARDFRVVQPGEPQVVLLEAGPRLLAAFEPELSDHAAKALADLGVDVRLNTLVQGISAQGVQIASGLLPSRIVIWAAGVQPRTPQRGLGLPLDAQGRIVVGPDCSVPGHPEIFAIGDLARFEQDGQPLPGLGAVAQQAGLAVADNLVRTLQGQPRRPFRYRDKGIMATIGRSRAVAQVGALKMRGMLAWLAWLLVHLLLLVGFRNRIMVFLEWVWQYFTFRSSARLITSSALHREGDSEHAAADELGELVRSDPLVRPVPEKPEA